MSAPVYGNRLLIVDDEPAFGRLVETVARNTGFEVRFTDDPAIFAKTARSWDPTVIVLDLKMPGTDGIQLLRSLAGDKCAAEIVISSGSDRKILDAAMQLGTERGLKMRGVLAKPIRIQALQQMLAGLRRSTREVVLSELAAAIEADQLFLEYQPKLDCRSGRINGVEGLVRWRHPERGLIRPDSFIPLAEEAGLIQPLTDWVFTSAVKQAAAWQAKRLNLEVAINISARDVEDIDLPERLERHCVEHGLNPSAIILELTETGAMREAVQMMDVLARLRLKGFRLSIDDFGTGYSSLVQLQRLPFSEIKIDQSFVRQIPGNHDCRVIAEIVVELGRRLGLKSVAEGVEDAAALEVLTEIGCDTAQGYHMSRPVAPERIPELVAAAGARLPPARAS